MLRKIKTLKKVAAWVRDTFARPAEKHSKRKIRLGVEALESREVPALFTWTGAVSTQATNSYNWEVTEGVPAYELPGDGDDVRFTAMSSGYHDAENLSPMWGASEAFGSLTLEAGYDGTVSVAPDATFDVGDFTLAGGAIAQPAPSTPIEITGTFTWTGGVLNSLANGASVDILGAGSINLPTDGTLYCGSTLNFSNPTAAAVETVISGAGTLLFNGTSQDAIFVRADAQVKFEGSTDAWAAIDSVNKTLTLDLGSNCGYVGTGTARPLGLRVINNGGKFYLHGQVTLPMTGAANTIAYSQTSGSWLFPSKLEIQSGCVLDVGNRGVEILGGSVWLTGNADLPVNQQIATIKGQYQMYGGSVGFGPPIQIGDGLEWCKFKVDGDVFWRGGSYVPGIDCGPGGTKANQWVVTGTMTVDTTFVDKPTINPAPQFLPQGQQPSGTWEVIIADPNAPNAKIEGNPVVPQGWILQSNLENGVNKKFSIKK
jgi:hypothetical protein